MWRRSKESGALEEVEQSLAGIFEGGVGKAWAGNQDQVVVRGGGGEEAAHCFAQETFCAVAVNGCANRLAGCDSHAQAGLFAFLDNQHNKRVGIRLARAPHPLEIFGPGQTEPSLHPRLVWGILPANLFDVFVGGDCQFVTPAQAAAFEDGAPIGSGHAFAEAVYAYAAADFGLVGSFWHSIFLVSKIIALVVMPAVARQGIIP
jgi:hypothetical protein